MECVSDGALRRLCEAWNAAPCGERWQAAVACAVAVLRESGALPVRKADQRRAVWDLMEAHGLDLTLAFHRDAFHR